MRILLNQTHEMVEGKCIHCGGAHNITYCSKPRASGVEMSLEQLAWMNPVLAQEIQEHYSRTGSRDVTLALVGGEVRVWKR